MTREEAIEVMKAYRDKLLNSVSNQLDGDIDALEMAIQALSQVSEIEENIIKYMKKYPNHVGNTDFWEGFYACRNVVLQLDDEEYAPKEQEPCDDAISRILKRMWNCRGKHTTSIDKVAMEQIIRDELPSVTQKSGKWIPASERLPENTYPVNITWVNHDPEPYYATIKDKPFTATGCYCDGKWYWYSVTCQDYLDEYRYCDVDSMDEAIEVIAWMPLPEPFEPQESEDKTE